MEYWSTGVLECWSDEILKKRVADDQPFLQYSSTPLLQHFEALRIQMRKKIKDLNKK